MDLSGDDKVAGSLDDALEAVAPFADDCSLQTDDEDGAYDNGSYDEARSVSDASSPRRTPPSGTAKTPKTCWCI